MVQESFTSFQLAICEQGDSCFRESKSGGALGILCEGLAIGSQPPSLFFLEWRFCYLYICHIMLVALLFVLFSLPFYALWYIPGIRCHSDNLGSPLVEPAHRRSMWTATSWSFLPIRPKSNGSWKCCPSYLRWGAVWCSSRPAPNAMPSLIWCKHHPPLRAEAPTAAPLQRSCPSTETRTNEIVTRP